MSLRPWVPYAPQRYLAESRERIAARESQLCAFTQLAQLDCAPHDGPLTGMPFAVKEIIDVAGMHIGYGSALYADRVPDQDADAVARLRSAGAVVAGVTTSTPFACGTTTVTANPHRESATPGGSSAGSGAAVGAGFVPVALASQSQASTLRPASYCGAWGFKPSHLRLPRGGMHLLSDTLDDLGLITASIDDLERTLAILTDPPAVPASSRPLRLAAVHLDDGGLPRPQTRAEYDALLTVLRTHPAVELVSPSAVGVFDDALAGSGRHCFDIFAGEAAPVLAGYVAQGEPDPRLREMLDHAERIGDVGLAAALARRAELRALHAGLATEVDALIALATTNPAPEGRAATGCRRLPATCSLLGVPAVTMPLLTVDGMPQGVQLIGFEGADEALLQVARTVSGVAGQSLKESI